MALPLSRATHLPIAREPALTRLRAALQCPLTHPVFLGCLLFALVTSAYIFASGKNTRAIASDGWGYYLYLPAVFIYGDIHFGFLNDKPLPPPIAQYRLGDGSWQGLLSTDTGYRDRRRGIAASLFSRRLRLCQADLR